MVPVRKLFTPRALVVGVLAWLLAASLQKTTSKKSPTRESDELAGPLGV
jgi:hypothetical protein